MASRHERFLRMSVARAAGLAMLVGMAACGGGGKAKPDGSDAKSEAGTGDAAPDDDAVNDMPVVNDVPAVNDMPAVNADAGPDSPDVASPDVASPDVASPDVASPDVASNDAPADLPSQADGGADKAVDAGPDATGAPDGSEIYDGPSWSEAGCFPPADAGVQTPPDAGLTLVADGRFGFTDKQGFCAWSYGYETPSTDGGFTLLPVWDDTDKVWAETAGTFWTTVGVDTQHPNGVTTSGGRMPVEQWSVRRWTSTLSGAVTITGVVHKSPAGLGGNGVDARVLVDGVVVYSHFVDGTDDTGVSFSIPATVFVGSTVDFVLDPHLANDAQDSTNFIVQIWH
jgi:hypothetical protein